MSQEGIPTSFNKLAKLLSRKYARNTRTLEHKTVQVKVLNFVILKIKSSGRWWIKPQYLKQWRISGENGSWNWTWPWERNRIWVYRQTRKTTPFTEVDIMTMGAMRGKNLALSFLVCVQGRLLLNKCGRTQLSRI